MTSKVVYSSKFEDNGDISSFPKSMFDFFTKPSVRKHITTKWLIDSIGSPTIKVQDYDIYAMGKRLGDRTPVFWTKMRILTRESERNVFQGNLGVKILEGYGKKSMDGFHGITMMRPVKIRKLITQDISDFKKRAVIHLGGDNFAFLKDIECFAEFPYYTSKDIKATGDNSVNCRKRRYYAKRMDKKKSWAHISKESILIAHKKKIASMIQPYRKNAPIGLYFEEFIGDILKIIEEVRTDYGEQTTSTLGYLSQIDSSEDSSEESSEESSVGEASDELVEDFKVPPPLVSKSVDSFLSSISMDSIRW